MEQVFDRNRVLRRIRHSRMLLAGIQAESGLDPRLKHSGVTILGVASLDPSRNFLSSLFCFSVETSGSIRTTGAFQMGLGLQPI
jgi:hypothetical protein